MFNPIIIATDLTKASDEIMSNLMSIKSLGVNTIILAHVREMSAARTGTKTYHYNNPIDEDWKRRAKSMLDHQKELLDGQGFSASVVLLSGTPSTEISNLAHRENAGLIILGSRGASIARNILLGSTALNILRASPVPILLKRIQVQEKDGKQHLRVISRDPTRHILFTNDFSSEADHSFTVLTQMAALGLEKVTLVHVKPPAEDDGEARIILGGLRRRLEAAGIGRVSIRIPRGEPAAEIVKMAEQPGVSLVMMGTHDKGLVQKFFLGSVSHEVARKIQVPLLLVSPHAEILRPFAAPQRCQDVPKVIEGTAADSNKK